MKKDVYELSKPQEAIWLTEQYFKNTNINDISCYADFSEKTDNVDFDKLKKAINNKVINENIEQTIFHYIFLTKIINLEEIYIQIKKEEDKILLELSENNNEQYDERFEIKKEEVDEDNIFRSYKDSNRFKLSSRGSRKKVYS